MSPIFSYCEGIVDTARKVIQQEGVLGLYRGLSSNVLRQCPAYAITFTCYELLSRSLQYIFI
jgi:hypothetical protein